MREKIILFLKRFPAIHRFVKNLYWKSLGLRAKIFGTKLEERKWKRRHLLKRSDWGNDEDWINGYWSSRSHPHRQLLIDKISQYLPQSILEIGSNCGPNLYLLAKKFPKAKIVGIDINEEAVKKGNEFFAKERIQNVKLIFGKADEIHQFQDKSFDSVFTDAVLMYIGPDKIKKVMKEIIRIAHKTLIFIEWHENSEKDFQGLGIYHFGHWKRNYINLLKQFVPPKQIHLTKIPKEIWSEKNWDELGYIIEVIIQKI